MQQRGKKPHLTEIMQLLEVENSINIKNPKNFRNRCSDTLCFWEQQNMPFFTLLLLYPTYNSGPPPALVTEPTEASACLLCLLLQDYVAKQEYPVVGH